MKKASLFILICFLASCSFVQQVQKNCAANVTQNSNGTTTACVTCVDTLTKAITLKQLHQISQPYKSK